MDLSKAQLAGIVTLMMLLSGVAVGSLTYNQDTTYFCADNQEVRDCSKGLSSTSKTCYFLDDSDVKRSRLCASTWVKIDTVVPKEPTETLQIVTEPVNVVSKPAVVDVDNKGNCMVHWTGCYVNGFLDKKVDCGSCR